MLKLMVAIFHRIFYFLFLDERQARINKKVEMGNRQVQFLVDNKALAHKVKLKCCPTITVSAQSQAQAAQGSSPVPRLNITLHNEPAKRNELLGEGRGHLIFPLAVFLGRLIPSNSKKTRLMKLSMEKYTDKLF